MNKTELVASLSASLETTKVQAGVILDTVLGTMATALQEGQDVSLRGFGTLKVKERAARQGRNPQTGDVLQIAAKKVVSFKSQITL